MDPLSMTASVIGIVTPTLHGVRLLTDDIQKIRDAPDAVKSIKDELLTIDRALQSLQGVSDPQWESLGEAVVNQSKDTITLCTDSCGKFRVALGRWTRHSDDGKLSWQDRAVVGFLKQGQIKSTLEQLQNCKTNLTLITTMASLHSSLQQSYVTGETLAALSAKETEVTNVIAMIDNQLADMNAKLGALVLAKQDKSETEADRIDAISQMAVEQTALNGSRELLQELLLRTQVAAANAQSSQDGMKIQFGDHNKGSQTGINHGTIQNTFGGRD